MASTNSPSATSSVFVPPAATLPPKLEPRSSLPGSGALDDKNLPGVAPIITDSSPHGLAGNANFMGGSLEKAPPCLAPSSTPEEEQEEEGDEGDSIMLYGPIVPSEGSEVELAASEIVSEFDDEETLEHEEPEETQADSPQLVWQNESGTTGWFHTRKGEVIEGVSDKVTEGTKSWKDKVESRKFAKRKTRWVPSSNKLSFQTTRRGYSLYFPPPVMDVLNKSLEGAKRADIIVAALECCVHGSVYLGLVSPHHLAGVLAAEGLIPILHLIGNFVARRWDAMKSLDKGQGIVLTATWRSPVHLIPKTWEAPCGGASDVSNSTSVRK